MEGWIIWIIIIIAWAVISNLSEKKETEDYVEALQENRFTIFVEEGIPPKKTGIDTECYTVQLKGMCNNLNDDTIKLLFYVYDNTDAEDDDFGLPVVAAHEALSEPGSRILGRHEIVETTANQYLRNMQKKIIQIYSFLLQNQRQKPKIFYMVLFTKGISHSSTQR